MFVSSSGLLILPRCASGVDGLDGFRAVVGSVASRLRDRLVCRRGRKPERPVEKYVEMVVVKEFCRLSLRGAEDNLSYDVFGGRVDHSVVHYWEKRMMRAGVLEEMLRIVGRWVEERLSYAFSVLDSTALTTWRKEKVWMHALTRVSRGFLYPVSASVPGVDTPS